MQSRSQHDLTRTLLLILIIAALIAGSLWTLRPFLSALIWAATIVVATWPLLLFVERRIGGRRSAATALMTIVVLAIFVVPFGLAVTVLLNAAIEGVELVRAVTREGLPAPPSWLASIPLVGGRLAARWQELAAGGPEAVTELLRPVVLSTASWAVSVTGGFTLVAVHFLMTVVLAAILYSSGETAARGVIMFACRIGTERGERAVRLAAQAVRGVALGVIVTALVQSTIAGVGLWLAGVQRPGLLFAVIFVLCVAQLGPLPVLVPAIIWLFWTGSVGWSIALAVLTVVVALTDNILKPLLIRRGVNLPLLLIIAGVIGGLIGFGVVGLFIGPVLLAVTFTLLEAWVREDTVPAVDPTRVSPAARVSMHADAQAAAPAPPSH
jgi:predicted PurR-regulated permease PerM